MIDRTRDMTSLLLLGVFLLVPLILWQAGSGLTAWNGGASVLKSIGQLSGLLGTCLFALNFVLAARFRFLEDALSGLPRVYSVHHVIGGIAFILLLMHPLFLGLRYLPLSLSLTASFFIADFTDLPKLWGLVALNILTLLLVITFFTRIAYHKWRATHQWMGLALLFAGLHVYLIPGGLTANPALRVYMVSVIIIGLLAFAYRTLLGRWLVFRYPYEVAEVEARGMSGTEVTLRPLGKQITYHAGQFFFIKVQDSRGIPREPHPFSFTSSPAGSDISFAAKPVGDYTSTLQRLSPGAKVAIEGPYGKFIFSHGSARQVWVAGGVGITPFMSRVRELNADHNQQITLYYVVKSKSEALFVQELQEVAGRMSSFTLRLWESTSEGKFDSDVIAEISQAESRSYFICGPTSLMADMKQGLKKKGVKSAAIFMEEFKLY